MSLAFCHVLLLCYRTWIVLSLPHFHVSAARKLRQIHQSGGRSHSTLSVFEDTCLRGASHAVTLFTTCSYLVCIEPDTFFSQVHTFQAYISRTFPCLLLMHCLFMQGYAADARLAVQDQCSRGGRNAHGSHLD